MSDTTESPKVFLEQRVFYWRHSYELDGKTHWALCDTLTDSERPSFSRVTCLEMILEETRHNPRYKPLSEEFFPRLIVQLLNEHYARKSILP